MDIIEARQGPANEAQPPGPQARRDILWTNTLTALSEPSLDPLFWRAERLGSPSAWWQHVPFAHWVVCATAPRILVELGTHTGVSYAAFCQAVERAGLPTRCHAVDTWRGDPHAGLYGPEILDELRAFHDERFGAFSTLLQCTFDEALDHIDDGSIDLLHIDGLHTYDAVRHDFESWLPKLSGRAVVMFHDINVRTGDFGVWRLWAELRQQYPGFEFVHGHGLGVLAVGADVPPPIAALCELADPDAVAMIRTRFARLGEHWWMHTRERMLGQELGRSTAAANSEAERLRAETEQLRAELVEQRAEAEQLRTEVARYSSEAEGLRAELVQQRGEAEQLRTELVQQQAEAEQLRAELVEQRGEAEQLRTELVQQCAGTEQLRAELGREADALRKATEHAWEDFRAASAKASELEQVTADLRTRAEQAEARAQHAEIEGSTVATRAAELDRALVQAWAERDSLLESTVWRATWPVRVAGRYLPTGMRRAVRGGAKLGWWTVTMKLPGKLRERREALQADQSVPATSFELLEEAPSYDSSAGAEDSVPRPAIISQHICAQSWVYVSGEPDTPGHRYRVLRPAAAAESMGVHTSWMRVEEITGRIAEIEAADALVIWRAPWDERIEAAVNAARRGVAKIVFDVDDLMVVPELARLDVIDGIRTQNLTEEQVQDHYARMRQTMAAADLCLATTEELADHMRRMFMPTVVVPNGVDHATIAASRLAARRRAAVPDDGLIRIGYAGGSRTHQRDFAVCADALGAALRERPQCRLVAFRSADGANPCLDIDEFPALRGLENRVEWRDLVPLERLPEEIARFDINLAPLEIGNPFCEAKSELKFFEASLVGVPTIASPTGAFRRAVRHGETGFLSTTSVEWQEALLLLIDDVVLRRRIARVAAREALWRFGPERRAELMAMLVDLVRGGRPAASAFAQETHYADAGLVEPRIPDHKIVFAADRLDTAEVTIVIPLYNYASYIEEALESVRAQTLAVLDLIVVEDCSTDNSFEVTLRWLKANAVRFNRVLLLRNKVNSGLAATRNAGFDAANTPYVLPLDADNRLLPNCVAECLRVARETGAAIAYPVIREFDHGHDILGDRPFDPVRLQFGNYIDAMALISKAAWVAVGGYDRGRGGWEDYGLLCRFVERGFWGERVPGGPLAEYRVHPTSMMKTSASQPKVIRRIMDEISAAHPWLRLVWPSPEPEPEVVQQSRQEMLLAPIAPKGKILEVGAGFGPIAPKSAGWNTKTLDHTNREHLIAKYTGQPGVDVSRIEEVDFVWNGGELSDAIPPEERGTFDGFIASHVIEHTPDLISFLNSIEALLKDNGVAALAIPDKRYCFDYFRPLTTTGQVLTAHLEQRSRHSQPAAFDYAAYCAQSNGSIAWGKHPTRGLRLVNSLEFGQVFAQSVSDSKDYVDMHAWCFVPASFELILLELAMLGKTNLRIEQITPVEGYEFLCWLRRGGKELVAGLSEPERAEARLALLKRIILETRDQVDWLLAAEPELATLQPPLPAFGESATPSQRVHGEGVVSKAPEVACPSVRSIQDAPKESRAVSGDGQPLQESTGQHELELKWSGHRSRLEKMLPLLRCPDTEQALVLSPEGDTLLSEDGSRRWRLVMGRPLLFPGLEAPVINPNAHLSNPLPASALAMIHSTSGPILHLSAGGTSERFEHVIEAEAAVFRHTDLICDVHCLPFKDRVFEAVIALNAFEHYRDPWDAAREIRRVLRPGGRVLIHTAFLQPLHEAPWHFYNCTRYGLEAWFEDFETEKLHVSENFHPGYSLSWLASECEIALRSRLSDAKADIFLAAPLHQIVSFWRLPEGAKADLVWNSLAALPQDAQEGLAAGFELIGRKPLF